MNYYPYTAIMPYTTMPARTGIFSNLFKGFNFSSILSGTGKVLNVANQAIPLIKQARPVINNAKTMFSVMNEFRKVDNTSNNNYVNNNNYVRNNNYVNNSVSNDSKQTTINYKNDSLPTFFQ